MNYEALFKTYYFQVMDAFIHFLCLMQEILRNEAMVAEENKIRSSFFEIKAFLLGNFLFQKNKYWFA